MPRRDWKRFRPISLQAAIEACIDFARERQNLSIDRVADRMGLPSKWALYKWVENGALPARLIHSFEHACGANFVTAYLAAAARKLLVDVPTSRAREPSDIHAVQESCTHAVTALLAYRAGSASIEDTQQALTAALEMLAHERECIERAAHPQLELS